jgi:predicted nucleotidyltransferase
MKFGLSDSDYQFIRKTLLPLEEKGAKIWCFGSRARGDHRKFSDLDLMLEGEGDFSRLLSDAREIFEESNLVIKIDLVWEKHFAESYRENYHSERVPF